MNEYRSTKPRAVLAEYHTAGLYDKFLVTRTDGTSEPGAKHCGCQYLVLDLTHDRNARAAARVYAELCEADRPVLSVELVEALDKIVPGERHLVSAKEVLRLRDLLSRTLSWICPICSASLTGSGRHREDCELAATLWPGWYPVVRP